MKYGTVTRLLAAAYVVIVQLTGCSPDTEELEKFPQAIPIRIVAEMNKGGGTSRAAGALHVHPGNGRRAISVRRNMRKPSSMSCSSLTRTSGTLRKKSFSITPKEWLTRWQM